MKFVIDSHYILFRGGCEEWASVPTKTLCSLIPFFWKRIFVLEYRSPGIGDEGRFDRVLLAVFCMVVRTQSNSTPIEIGEP
jgi:hypothetical protein